MTKQIRAEDHSTRSKKVAGLLPSSHLRRSFCTISNGATSAKTLGFFLRKRRKQGVHCTAIWQKIPKKSPMFHGRSHELHPCGDGLDMSGTFRLPASWNPCETLGIVPPATSWKIKGKQILSKYRCIGNTQIEENDTIRKNHPSSSILIKWPPNDVTCQILSNIGRACPMALTMWKTHLHNAQVAGHSCRIVKYFPWNHWYEKDDHTGARITRKNQVPLWIVKSGIPDINPWSPAQTRPGNSANMWCVNLHLRKVRAFVFRANWFEGSIFGAKSIDFHHFPSFSIISHGFSIMFHHFSWIFHHFSWIFHHFSSFSMDFPSFFMDFPSFSIIFHHFSWIFHYFSWIFHHFPSFSMDFW
jgi:hypothetical protein